MLKDIGMTLLDLKAWFTAFMYFSCNVVSCKRPCGQKDRAKLMNANRVSHLYRSSYPRS